MKVTIRPDRFGGQVPALLQVLLLLLALLLPPTASGQPDDRTPVTVRRPSAGRLADLRSSREYRYDRESRPPDNSLARFLDWLMRRVARFLSSSAYQNFWQYVFMLGVAGLVVWLLMKANIMGNLFSRESRQMPLAYATVTDNIHEIAFSERIEEAVEQRNYRLAVRLLYLQTLKHLTDRGLIVWQPDKTNRSYVYELAQTPYRPDFEELTRQYEYAWYGDFPVTEPQFQTIRERFSQFEKAKW